jgi:hypothetical protein
LHAIPFFFTSQRPEFQARIESTLAYKSEMTKRIAIADMRCFMIHPFIKPFNLLDYIGQHWVVGWVNLSDFKYSMPWLYGWFSPNFTIDPSFHWWCEVYMFISQPWSSAWKSFEASASVNWCVNSKEDRVNINMTCIKEERVR